MSRARPYTALGPRTRPWPAPRPAPPPLIVVAHGTRVPAGAAVAAELLDGVRALLPGTPVRCAYLGVTAPSLTEVLADVRGEAVVVPLLLGAGYHVRVDIPRAVAAAPWVSARVAPALGPDPALADALADRLYEAGARRGDQIVLAAAGSSDERSNAGAVATARMLSGRPGFPAPGAAGPPGPLGRVRTAYISGPVPDLAETIARCRARTGHRVAVATYLLAPGRFAQTAAAAGADVVSAPLGAHDALVALVAARYHRAAHRAALPAPPPQTRAG